MVRQLLSLLIVGVVTMVPQAEAQQITSGPNLIQRNGDKYVYEVTFDVATPLSVQFRKASEAAVTIDPRPSAAAHRFEIPGSEPHVFLLKYGLGSASKQSQEFRTIPVIEANFGAPLIEDGNQLTIPFTSRGVTSVRVEYSVGANTSRSEVPRTDGSSPFIFRLPYYTATPSTPMIVSYRITALAGESAVGVSPYSTVTTLGPVGPLYHNGTPTLAASPSSLTLTSSGTGASVTIMQFRATLNRNGFVHEKAGTCPRISCAVTFDGLDPGTNYGYTFAIASAPNSTWDQHAGTASTQQRARVKGRPKLEYDEASKQLRLIVETTERATVKLNFKPDNLTLQTDPTPPDTHHEIVLNGVLSMTKGLTDRFNREFEIVVTNAADGVQSQELPSEFQGKFEGVRSQDKKSAAQVLKSPSAEITDFIKAYGPYIKTAVTAVIAAL